MERESKNRRLARSQSVRRLAVRSYGAGQRTVEVPKREESADSTPLILSRGGGVKRAATESTEDLEEAMEKDEGSEESEEAMGDYPKIGSSEWEELWEARKAETLAWAKVEGISKEDAMEFLEWWLEEAKGEMDWEEYQEL